MCNDYRLRRAYAEIADRFAAAGVSISSPPLNIEPRDDIKITDSAPVVRCAPDGATEMVSLRWSWPGPGGKPVYNFRSEGRRFATGRCLIPADGFYEFTDPEPPAPKRGRKTKWLFTMVDEPVFAIAGLWRPSDQGDAFTMLTCEPGPDIAPYHSRQVAVLGPATWAKWLFGEEPEEVLRPAVAGTLGVKRQTAASA